MVGNIMTKLRVLVHQDRNKQMERTDWTILQRLKSPERSDFADSDSESLTSEYAILILNQPILCEPEVVATFWKNAAFRVLVDGGSNRWLDFLSAFSDRDLDLPDFISGDFDSITEKTREHYEKLKVNMIFTPDQNETDFTKALRCAKSVFETKNLNIKFVIAVCENAGRFDQIMSNMNTLHRTNQVLGDIPVILLSSQSATWVLQPGNHRIVVTEEFVKKHYSCGLIPFCGPTRVTTRGLKWNLENCTMEISGLVSTSNTYTKTEISVTSDRHLVWTSQFKENNK